jgi:hypothetical protein
MDCPPRPAIRRDSAPQAERATRAERLGIALGVDPARHGRGPPRRRNDTFRCTSARFCPPPFFGEVLHQAAIGVQNQHTARSGVMTPLGRAECVDHGETAHGRPGPMSGSRMGASERSQPRLATWGLTRRSSLILRPCRPVHDAARDRHQEDGARPPRDVVSTSLGCVATVPDRVQRGWSRRRWQRQTGGGLGGGSRSVV